MGMHFFREQPSHKSVHEQYRSRAREAGGADHGARRPRDNFAQVFRVRECRFRGITQATGCAFVIRMVRVYKPNGSNRKRIPNWWTYGIGFPSYQTHGAKALAERLAWNNSVMNQLYRHAGKHSDIIHPAYYSVAALLRVKERNDSQGYQQLARLPPLKMWKAYPMESNHA